MQKSAQRGRIEGLVGLFAEPYQLLWRHRQILGRVVVAKLRQRHAGSFLGALWLIIGPLLLLATYIFMFVAVFGVKIPGLSLAQNVAHMSCGLVLFLFVSQALTSATTSLSQEPSLLFNQVFPAELFPVREVLSASPLFLLALILAPIWAIATQTFNWAWLMLPLLLWFTFLAIVGCSWILSLANLITKDTSQLLVYVLAILMLASPIAYQADMLPEGAQLLVELNPFAYFVQAWQLIVVHGQIPKTSLIVGTSITSLLVFHVAFGLFKRGKSFIAENI